MREHLFLTPLPMSKVVASKVKEMVNAKGMMCSGDLIEAMDKMMDEMVAKACKRCEENGRKTVRPCDL